MNKKTVVKSGFGGFFIGISTVSMLFNAAMHNSPIFIVSGIVGILGGCGLLVIALSETK